MITLNSTICDPLTYSPLNFFNYLIGKDGFLIYRPPAFLRKFTTLHFVFSRHQYGPVCGEIPGSELMVITKG
jgi:hypothetical protein